MSIARLLLTFAVICICLFAYIPRIFAAYGWQPTDNPVPFYYQQAGRWYQTDDTKIFMIELDERTYKYVFSADGSFISGWVTNMPVRMP